MKLPFITAATALVFITACSTAYQEPGFTGGVKAAMLDTNTAQISAKGNAYTNSETIWRYALLKSAEATLAHGFGHFALIDSESYEKTTTTANTHVTTGYYPTAYTTVNTQHSPRSNFIIKMYKGQKPSNAPANIFDAQSVYDTLITQVDKPS